MGNEGDNGGQANENGNNLPPNKRFYKVAFSFTSGNDNANRDFVRKVAEALRDTHKVAEELIFFDEWANLDGRADADLLLEKIYKECSEYIVPFFSEDYLETYWTGGVEYEPIRIIKHKYPKALIPARLEDVEVEGFPNETTFFINCYEEKETYETVAKIIAGRIKEEPPRILISTTSSNSGGNNGNNGNNDDNTFPFTNREKELELILTSKIKDQLITAPVSYGKKTFLKRLKKKFDKKGYVTFLEEINDQDIVEDAEADELCKYFGFNNSADFIAQKLTEDIKIKIKDKGLVFIFITKGVIGENLKYLKDSIEELRKKIKNKLQTGDQKYQHRDKKIRLIVSSRQLHGDIRNKSNWPYGYESVTLSEFTDQVILDSLKAKKFFLGKSEDEYTSIVAKLTLLTAGHPAIVKSTAENFKAYDSFDVNKIKNKITLLSLDFSASIKNAKVKNLFGAKKIPLYRYIDDTLLANIVGKSRIKREDVFSSLLSHGIYEEAVINGSPSKVIKDSLLRRTCAIDYCYQQPDDFLISANNAKAFYFRQFDNGQCRLDFMILWLVECWYNDLQKKLLSFSWSEQDYNEKVGDINTKLFQEIPAHIEPFLNHIKADNSKPEEGEKRLLERLEHDWEFKLLLSYLPYKPDTQCYSTDAYNNLVSLIEKTFAEQQGANHE